MSTFGSLPLRTGGLKSFLFMDRAAAIKGAEFVIDGGTISTI
jgi:hypothetical protein